MTARTFTLGDRVRRRITRGVVQAGTCGTIEDVMEAIDAYIIRCDGHDLPRFVRATDLERCNDVPQPGAL